MTTTYKSQRNIKMQIGIPAFCETFVVYFRFYETSQHSYASNPRTKAV